MEPCKGTRMKKMFKGLNNVQNPTSMNLKEACKA